MLLLDDLHWADAGTLRLLAHLLRRPERAASCSAPTATARSSRAHPLAATLADLRRDGLVERVALRGPRRAGGRAARPARRGTGGARRALHRETGGNPFFVEEVLRHLDRAGCRGGALPIPEGVKDVIGRRLSRLARRPSRVLAIAAVAGREFDVDAAGDGARRATRSPRSRRPRAAQMVREEPGRPGRYAFAHALVRETLYDELSLTRRVRTAPRARRRARACPAAARRARPPPARGGGRRRPRRRTPRSPPPREAMRALAYEEAAALCERALDALDGSDEPAPRGELLLALGEARLRAGENARASVRRGGRARPRRSGDAASCSPAPRSGSAGSG